ncbi:MAG TPA: carbamoyl-phosphate synthase large subunit, partial [Chloroflexota bacterium]
ETPASFEPTIDYVVTKVPRFTFEKFPEADATLTTQMKSVGETMAIGRTFKESLQKALRGLETGRFGLGADRADRWFTPNAPQRDEIVAKLTTPNAERLWYLRYALLSGMSVEDVHKRTRIDPWFLENIKDLVDLELRLRGLGTLENVTPGVMLEAKQHGFLDRQLANLWNASEQEVRRLREGWGIRAVFKCVDTCAAEFEAYTPYYYSTYEAPTVVVEDPASLPLANGGKQAAVGQAVPDGEQARQAQPDLRPDGEQARPAVPDLRPGLSPGGRGGEESPFTPDPSPPRGEGRMVPAEDEIRFKSDRPKVIILGGGPNRIGQGIEFDYCCVKAVQALRKAGYETVMVNSNPETVSTDYDTSDYLFFEPLTAEDVLNIWERFRDAPGGCLGVVVQFGGQTPLNLAKALEAAGVTIVGTSTDSIDKTEDRKLFSALLKDLGLAQPPSAVATEEQEAVLLAREIGYPLLARPSFVLGGRGMRIVDSEEEFLEYVRHAIDVSPGKPLLIDKFLDAAVEVDVDCLADGERALIGGVMEHIEEAGIHSGDSACVIPPHRLPREIVEQIKDQTRRLALALNVKGLMNIQFAVTGMRGNTHELPKIYILEANPRASRTVPFVSKATGVPLAEYAALVIAGRSLAELGLTEEVTPVHFSVKESVFPFNKFPGVDTILGPEMRSTGEVMGIDDGFPMAFLKSQVAASSPLPCGGKVFVSVANRDKRDVVPLARRLAAMGYTIVSTPGTARELREAGVEVQEVPK